MDQPTGRRRCLLGTEVLTDLRGFGLFVGDGGCIDFSSGGNSVRRGGGKDRSELVEQLRDFGRCNRGKFELRGIADGVSTDACVDERYLQGTVRPV